MAQETRLAPIEFSNTPTQVLMSIAENNQQQDARRRQLEFEQQKYLRQLLDEETKRKIENAKNFNSIIQDKQWSKETRDLFMNDLVKKYSNPQMGSMQYLSEIGKDLTQISNYQRIRDDVYDRADKFLAGLPATSKDGFDFNAFKNDYIKNALFKQDGTQKSLQELQAESDIDWLEKTFTTNKDRYYNVASAFKKIPDIIKSAPESTLKVPDRDRKGRVLTSSSTEIKFRPQFERFNEKTGKVEFRQDANGFIEDEVYKSLISFDDIDALATRSANKFITDYNNSTIDQKKALLGGKVLPPGSYTDADNDGLPDALESDDLDLIKKGFLTDYIRKQMPQYNKETETTKIISVGGGGGGGPRKTNDTSDFIDEVINTYNNGTPQDLADVVYRMRAGNGKYELTNVKVSDNKTITLEYYTGKEDEDGNKIVEKKTLDPTSKYFRIELANFYQKATGSDARAEKRTLIGDKDKETKSKGKEKSIKRSDIAAKAQAAGYTPGEYEALLKQKGIKIIN